MKKRILFLGVLLIIAFSMICGCQKKHGEFYTLQEAYDNGYLTTEDLEQIADYLYPGENCPEELDSDIANMIKNDAAYDIRHQEINKREDAKPEDIQVLYYFGEFSGSYVVRLRSHLWVFTTDLPHFWYNIGGVEIHILGHDPCLVWRETK